MGVESKYKDYELPKRWKPNPKSVLEATGRKKLRHNEKRKISVWFFEFKCGCGNTVWINSYNLGNKRKYRLTGCKKCIGTGLSTDARFNNSFIKGKKNDCWIWTGPICIKYGYGQFSLSNNGKKVICTAQRYALKRALGRSLKSGKMTRQLCQNKKCVNPNHLKEDTLHEILKDRKANYSSITGSRNIRALVNEKTVARIKEKIVNTDMTNRAIGEKFSVSGSFIYQIRIGNNWKQIPWPEKKTTL